MHPPQKTRDASRSCARGGDSGGSATSLESNVGGQSVPVLYAGGVAAYAGLDQVNISIPKSLAGSVRRIPDTWVAAPRDSGRDPPMEEGMGRTMLPVRPWGLRDGS